MKRLPVTRRTVVRAALAAGCILAVLGVPRQAGAQKEPFIDALIAFRTSLAGTYGDEGAQVSAELDRMAASLTEWDRLVATAEAELRPALPGAPPEEVLRLRTTLAALLMDRGRLSDALVEVEAALALDPERAAFHLFRGLIRDAAGDSTDALRDYRRAWDLDPADPIKAYLAADRGRPPVDDAAALPPQIDALLAARSRKEAPASFIRLALVEDSAADWPVFAPAAYADGFALIAARKYHEAVASFRTAAARDPLAVDRTPASERMVRGIADLKEKQFAAAIAHLEAAVAAAPESSEAQRLLGVAYGAGGRPRDGIERLRTAVRLAPGDERARIALGRALMRADRLDEAEQVLRETVDALPASAEARWALADLYERQDRGEDAIRELEAARTLPMLAGRAQLLWRLAELLHRHQHFDGVADTLAARVRLDPNNAKAHKDLGLAEMRRGGRREALLELLMTGILGGEDAETLATIGQIHLDEGRHEAAEAVLREAVAIAPELAQARFALGTTLVRLGRVEEGREQLAEFRRLRDAALDEQRRAFDKLAEPGR